MSRAAQLLRHKWAAAALVFIAALALRLVRLSHDCLWLDECLTLKTATQPTLGALLRYAAANDPHPPLYFIGMHYWLALAGHGAVALRFPSAFFGALACPGVFALARRLMPQRPAFAWLAAGLLCIAPMHLYYSQEARAYALQVCVEVFAFYCVLRALTAAQEAGAFRWAAGGLALGAVALWIHYFSLFINAALLACLAWRWRAAVGRRQLCVVGLLAAWALLAAWPLAHLVMNLTSGQGVAWLPEHYGPSLLLAAAQAQLLGPLFEVWPRGVWLGLLLGCGLVGRGLWNLRGRCGSAAALLVVAGLVCTCGGPVGISFIKPITYWGQRYEVIAQPFVALLLALGAWPAGTSRRRWLWPGLLAGLCAFQAAYAGSLFTYRHRPVCDTVWEVIGQRGGLHSIVWVCPKGNAVPLQYYAPPAARVQGLERLELIERAHLAGWLVFISPSMDPAALLRQYRVAWHGPLVALASHTPLNELYIVELGAAPPTPQPKANR